jgi:hypothetical protein
MAKTNVAQLAVKIYGLLSPLESADRGRVVQAALVLLGEEQASHKSPSKPGSAGGSNPSRSTSDPGIFIDQKSPANKGEVLAVAARFRELQLKEENHSKADLKKVITDARRNFDDTHFSRDMNNARRQAGFFNLGTGRDACKLSYYGQQFVDALPDREAAAKISRPKIGGARKRAATK